MGWKSSMKVRCIIVWQLYWCTISTNDLIQLHISDGWTLLSSYPYSSSNGEVALENTFTHSFYWLGKVFSFSVSGLGFLYIVSPFILLSQWFSWLFVREYGEVSWNFVADNQNLGHHSYCSSSEPARYTHLSWQNKIYAYSSSPPYCHFGSSLFFLTLNFVLYRLKGFISLDCGLPANEPSPYKEESTGLQFSSDATFIQSGKTGRIHPTLASRFLKPYTTLRYFPDGTRNCYNLRVEKGRNHLIRARFLYGNYDGLDNNPTFDLYLGPNPWATIDLHKLVNGTREEIIHIPTSNKLQVCLVKTGPTTPVISTLEVRPMGNDSYSTQSGSLNLFFRLYLSESKTTLR